MRILSITPIRVTERELARRQQRYDRLAPDGIDVHLVNLAHTGTPGTPEAPRALETAVQVRASESLLAAQFATVDPAAYDALLPDCVLDPVVGGEDVLPLPLHGISRLTAHHLAGLGGRLGAVARNQAIADELDRKLVTYGIATAAPTAVMHLCFDAVADEAAWATAVGESTAGLELDVVINACSAVEVGGHRSGPRLVDPTRLALELLALHARSAVSA